MKKEKKIVCANCLFEFDYKDIITNPPVCPKCIKRLKDEWKKTPFKDLLI